MTEVPEVLKEIKFDEIEKDDLLKVVMTITRDDYESVTTWNNVKVRYVGDLIVSDTTGRSFDADDQVKYYLISRPAKLPELYSEINQLEVINILPVGAIVKAVNGMFSGYTVILHKTESGWVRLVDNFIHTNRKSALFSAPQVLLSNYEKCILIHLPN